MHGSLAERFPLLTQWILNGWIELGPTDWTRSFIRVLDEGGTVWEGKEAYETFEEAFAEAEAAIEAW